MLVAQAGRGAREDGEEGLDVDATAASCSDVVVRWSLGGACFVSFGERCVLEEWKRRAGVWAREVVVGVGVCGRRLELADVESGLALMYVTTVLDLEGGDVCSVGFAISLPE